jgi:hypothetical protein
LFHKDDTEKFYKLHASKVVEYVRKVYSIGLQDVYCESRVYNAAHFYTLDQTLNHPSDKALSTLLVSPSVIDACAIYGAMNSKKTEELVHALDVVITKYRSHHKVVHITSTDHESVLKSEQLALQLNERLRNDLCESYARRWKQIFLNYLSL